MECLYRQISYVNVLTRTSTFGVTAFVVQHQWDSSLKAFAPTQLLLFTVWPEESQRCTNMRGQMLNNGVRSDLQPCGSVYKALELLSESLQTHGLSFFAASEADTVMEPSRVPPYSCIINDFPIWFPSGDTHLPCFGSLWHTHAHIEWGLLGASDWASSRLPSLIRVKSIEVPGLELGLIELCSLCSLIAAKSVLSPQHLVHMPWDQGGSCRAVR